MHPYCDTRVHHILVSYITVLCSIVNITNSFGNLNPCHQCCQSRADCSNYSRKHRERNKLNCCSKFIMICCRCIIISIVRCISIEWVFTIVYCTTIGHNSIVCIVYNRFISVTPYKFPGAFP